MVTALDRIDAPLGGAPEGLDAIVIAEKLTAVGGAALVVARAFQR